jgi:hypothetical protein
MEPFTEYMHSYMRDDTEHADTVPATDTRDYCVVEYQGRRLYVIPVSATDWLIYTSDTDGRVVPTPSLEPRIPPEDWNAYKRVLDWCFMNRDTDFVLEFLRVPSRAVIYHTVKHLTIAAPEALMQYATSLIRELTTLNSPYHGSLATNYFLQLLHHVPITDPEVFHQLVTYAMLIHDRSYRAHIVLGLARQKDQYIERAFKWLENRSEAERAATARLYGYILELSGLPNYDKYRAVIGNPFVPPAQVLVARLLPSTLG